MPTDDQRAGRAVIERAVLPQYRDSDDYDNEQRHPCGCVTFFDLVRWHSVIVLACADHEGFRYVP